MNKKRGYKALALILCFMLIVISAACKTKEDQTVTIRNRDTMEQERISISEIANKIKKSISYKDWLN